MMLDVGSFLLVLGLTGLMFLALGAAGEMVLEYMLSRRERDSRVK